MSRYTVTFTERPGAKARIRHVLKLLGAESVRIQEQEQASTEGVGPSTKPKKDNLPTSPEAKAVADLFKRRHETPWADEEITAFRAAQKTGMLTLENMTTVTNFYQAERKKTDHRCRTSVLTFCKHFGTELDKAKAVKPSGGRAMEWADSRPKILPMIAPAEDERIRAEAKALKDQLTEQFRKGVA